MIVDDHPAFRELLRTFLRTTEATFLECEDGRDAVADYPGFQPDVVLMDIAMKDMAGLSATARITTRFPPAHVVILTQYDDPDLRAAATRAGACDYLPKDQLSRLPEVLRAWSSPSEPPEPKPI